MTERTGPATGKVLTRLDGATNAKLALGAGGSTHVAYVVYADEAMRDGTLHYASSADGFQPVRVRSGVDAGWEEPETDGSFAIAVGPAGEVATLWNDGRARDRAQPLAILRDGQWERDHPPLRPGHGNPQYTMRPGYSALGHLSAASGYGGTDTLAVRSGPGGWASLGLPRYDVWDTAVAPSGQVYFAYTQPHGATTVAASTYLLEGKETAEGARPAHTASLPDARGAPLPALAGLVALACALVLRRRR
ncbi:MAG TPA: hypothetical protein VFH47_06865 [Candidatus Thermoplasmatota archaeon]|nr:hypothetical protein [Candidatus Thermoplasmatota archaeon]